MTAALLAAAAALLLTSLSSVNGGSQLVQNPGIIPIQARFGGLSYGEWQNRLWQWTYSLPASINPTLIGNEAEIALGQPKELWFLFNLNGSLPIERHFTVPAGTALFACIISGEWDNYICVDPPTDFNADNLRSIAGSAIDQVSSIEVEIDGVPIHDVMQYRSTGPVFDLVLPSFAPADQNVAQFFGCDTPPGTYSPAIADGYNLILAPLPPGEHVIHEKICSATLFPVPCAEVTWHITVVPKNP
jgi:hypothetical protein